MRLVFVLSFCGLLLATSACSANTKNPTLWVFAASSLEDAFKELGDNFEANDSDARRGDDNLKLSSAKLRFQFGGSSSLVRQINEGAPSQILAVANDAVLAELKEPYIAEVFARSQLVIAVPRDNPKNITRLKDLENSNLTLGICAPDVPCGNLAMEVFAAANLELNPDTRETSARSVLNKLLLGELDVGLIYEVDVLAANRKNPQLLGIPIEEVPKTTRENDYLLATIDADNQDQELVASFRDYLQSPAAKNILLNYGFEVPNEVPDLDDQKIPTAK